MNDMRAGDLFTRLYWYNRQRKEDKLEQFRLTRLQTFELINIQLNRRDKLKNPSQLWPLAEEKEPDNDIKEGRTQDQIDNLVALMKKVENGNDSES